MRLRGMLGLLGLGLVALLIGSAASALTAANSVPITHAGVNTRPIGANDLKPRECTGTVNTIAIVPSGGAPYAVSTAGNLILGTSGNDKVAATTGYNCFIGGGPISSNRDQFTGPPNTSYDQCIVATSDPSTNIHNCTIVARRP